MSLLEVKDRKTVIDQGLRAFLEVCEAHGRTAAQHHDQFVARFIGTPPMNLLPLAAGAGGAVGLLLGGVLAGLGAILIARSIAVDGEPLARFRLPPLAVVVVLILVT